MLTFKKKLGHGVLVALTAFAALGIGGCPAPATNLPPVAAAGNNQNVDAGDQVVLDGSDSSDPEGGALNFSWEQTSGTSVTLSDDDDEVVTFTAPNVDETLIFELTVTDNAGATDTDTVAVTVTASDDNQSPNADAGNNQSVEGGTTVQLDGSNSSDPDGDTLSFQWTQTAGTSVGLTGANTDSPSFTAPDTDETLTFQLTVSDGNGGSDTDSVNVTVTQSVEPRLYIANFNGDNIVSYANPSTVNGNIPPDTNLAGAQTLLNDPSDMVVNANNKLIVSNFNGNSVTTYNNADQTNGNLEPNGNVTGAATQLIDPVTLAINTAQDLLFVADIFSDSILVFTNTASSGFNGNVAPTRIITSADINNPFGINFGANDELYVANNATNSVSVFANASNLNGNISATRIITSAVFDGIFDVFIDANDTMFVVDSVDAEIYIFNDAASLNGPVAPDFTLEVLPGVTLTAIAVDSNDTGYIVDFAGNAIYSYNNISTRNGPFNPNRTIAGNQTQIVGPIRVFLTE